MLTFTDLVEKIRQSPPNTGFGAKHYKAGLSGQKLAYGRSTLMDAYYWAGRKNSKK